MNLLLFMLLAAPARPVAPPPTASAIVTAARRQAARTHRPVMLLFHATWCGWCHRLDDAMGTPELKPLFQSNFTVIHVDVLEHGAAVAQYENAGGQDMLKAYGGEKSGIPFYVFLDPYGKVLGDSNVMPGHANIGYPGSKAEIDAFTGLLHRANPRMSRAALDAVAAWFQSHQPSHG